MKGLDYYNALKEYGIVMFLKDANPLSDIQHHFVKSGYGVTQYLIEKYFPDCNYFVTTFPDFAFKDFLMGKLYDNPNELLAMLNTLDKTGICINGFFTKEDAEGFLLACYESDEGNIGSIN